jgi:hypothetical protein
MSGTSNLIEVRLPSREPLGERAFDAALLAPREVADA